MTVEQQLAVIIFLAIVIFGSIYYGVRKARGT